MCGGHGDRFHGAFSLLLLAVETQRLFLIDSIVPVPLALLLEPAGTPSTRFAHSYVGWRWWWWRCSGAKVLNTKTPV